MSEVRIRHYVPSDRDALNELFGRAGADSPTGELWGHEPSERAIYLDPYVDADPESVLLAEVGGGFVGYLTGCLDHSALPSEEELFNRAISEHRLMLKPRALRFFARSTLDIVKAKARRQPTASGEFDDHRWPSHLHINVAPQARGTGAADALMKAWFQRMDAEGSPGCHLQTLKENTRAIRFFERMGFTAHGTTPVVPGLRFRGGPVHQLTMVRASPHLSVDAAPGAK